MNASSPDIADDRRSQRDGFVTVRGTELRLDGRSYRFLGANDWQAMIVQRRTLPTGARPYRGYRPTSGARREALMRNRSFIDDYADARARWRDGVATAFPAGTYWLQRFAAVPILPA